MISSIEVSIIIVSYNTREILLKCINSIIINERKIKFEIIVIDNNSSDQSVAAIGNSFPMVRIFPLDRNIGFAAANNLGIRCAKGEYVLFLNPDTIFIEPLLESLLCFYREHKNAQIIGCKILNSDKTWQRSFFPFTNLIYVLWVSLLIDRIIPIAKVDNHWRFGHIRPTKAIQVDRLLGAFMLLKRQTIEKVGSFDEEERRRNMVCSSNRYNSLWWAKY
jgi:hypothetical protein